jgi:hypothetical protein
MNNMKLRWTPRDLSDVALYHNDALIGKHIKSSSIKIDDARDRLDGLKQFLYICAAVPGAHAPSSVVATMWHSFPISSKDYRDFCHGYLGRFIDHRTLETPSRETYLATRRAAEGVFGQLDEKIWPASADGASHDDNGPNP